MSATNKFVWPSNNPTSGDVLKVLSYSNPNGILEWGTGGGGTPGGITGNVQYNDGSGGFAGSANLNFDDTTNTLSSVSMNADLFATSIWNVTGTTGTTMTNTTGSFTISNASASGNFIIDSVNNNIVIASLNGNTSIDASGDLQFRNSTTTTYTWPTVDATANQVLSAGSTPGTMEWVSQSGGGGSPGGVLGSVQFNNPLGTFDGDANLTYDSTNTLLRLSRPGSSSTNIPSIPATASVLEVRNTNLSQDAYVSIVSNTEGISNIFMGSDVDPVFGLIKYLNADGQLNIENTGSGGVNMTTAGNIIIESDININLIATSNITLQNVSGVSSIIIDTDNSLIVDPSGANEIKLNATNGMVTATEFRAVSDRRLKKNITPLKSSLDTVLNIDEVEYQLIKNDEHAYGFIAQQLEEIGLGNLVGTDERGQKNVSYSQIIPLLVGSIKELDKRLRLLEKNN